MQKRSGKRFQGPRFVSAFPGHAELDGSFHVKYVHPLFLEVGEDALFFLGGDGHRYFHGLIGQFKKTRRVDPTVVSEADLFEVIRTSFGQRRKMLRKLLGDRARVDAALQAVNALVTARAEELSLEQWIELANQLR